MAAGGIVGRAAVALALLCAARAEFIHRYNGQLYNLKYACPLALKEGGNLLETDLGSKIVAASFRIVFDEIDTAIREMADDICVELMRELEEKYNIELPDFTMEECVRTIIEIMPDEVKREMVTCDEDEERVRQLCYNITPGTFCVYGKRYFEPGTSENPGPDGKMLTCVVTQRREVPTNNTCPPGFYCSGGDIPPLACPKGLYCPNATPAPYDCAVGQMCLVSALTPVCNQDLHPLLDGADCSPDFEGKVILPDNCEAGYFCKDGIPKPCLPGHFCMQGTRVPIPCSDPNWWLSSSCPEGSAFPGNYLPSLILNGQIVLQMCILLLLIRWERVGGLLAGLWLVAFWVHEVHYDNPTEVAWTLTTYAWGIVWGAFVSPKIKPLLRHRLCKGIYRFIDWNGILAPALLLFFYDNFNRSVYVCLLLYTLIVSERILLNKQMRQRFSVTLVLFSSVGVYFVAYYILNLDEVLPFLQVIGLASFIPFIWSVIRSCFRTCRWNKKSVREAENKFQDQDYVQDIATGTSTQQLGTPSTQQPCTQQLPFMTNRSMSIPCKQEPAIGLTMRDVSLYLPSGQTILRHISLVIPPESVVAVMGSSGSGKSSITNVLAHRAGYGIVAGAIEVNGDPRIPLQSLQQVTGFVPQDDVMHRELTCVENIAFQARLRLPKHVRLSEDVDWAEQEADRMLELFGLSHVRDQLIGDESTRGISGGQRKRVSIAMEFVSQPSLLFLDEPTSGLDSTTSHTVVKLVAANARKTHCTTLAVIHQPRFETLKQFDNVILLATGGYLIYAGPTKDVVNYFSSVLGVQFQARVNPADIIMDSMSLESTQLERPVGHGQTMARGELTDAERFGEQLASSWKEHGVDYMPRESVCIRDTPNLTPTRDAWGRLWLSQLSRAAIQSRRSWRHHALMNVLQVVGVLSLLSAIPREDSQLLFFQVSFAYLFLMLANSMAAQRVFGGNERIVAWRESGVRINSFYYFLGRDLVALAEIAVSAAIFTMFYWPLGPLICTQHEMFLATFAFTYATYGYSYLLSTTLDASPAQMSSVLFCFICWFVTGMEPSFSALVTMLPNSMGIYLMAISPVRWVHGFLLHKHMGNIRNTQYRNPLLWNMVGSFVKSSGYNLEYIEEFNVTDWSCEVAPLTVRQRWSGSHTLGFGSDLSKRARGTQIAFNCHIGHSLLLGFLIRTITLIVLTAVCKTKANGGGALFESKNTKTFFSKSFAPALNSFFWAFLINLFVVEIVLLLEIP